MSGSYHQLEVLFEPEGGFTIIKVGSRIKSLVAQTRSSGVEEEKVLKLTADALRIGEPDITNLGISE